MADAARGKGEPSNKVFEIAKQRVFNLTHGIVFGFPVLRNEKGEEGDGQSENKRHTLPRHFIAHTVMFKVQSLFIKQRVDSYWTYFL